jgi:hypothetical protein
MRAARRPRLSRARPSTDPIAVTSEYGTCAIAAAIVFAR